jgi:hypothetical protein
VVTDFSKIDIALIKIGTVHLKFGEKSDSVRSDFFNPPNF